MSSTKTTLGSIVIFIILGLPENMGYLSIYSNLLFCPLLDFYGFFHILFLCISWQLFLGTLWVGYAVVNGILHPFYYQNDCHWHRRKQ
jgi:hypothetical protein